MPETNSPEEGYSREKFDQQIELSARSGNNAKSEKEKAVNLYNQGWDEAKAANKAKDAANIESTRETIAAKPVDGDYFRRAHREARAKYDAALEPDPNDYSPEGFATRTTKEQLRHEAETMRIAAEAEERREVRENREQDQQDKKTGAIVNREVKNYNNANGSPRKGLVGFLADLFR